MNELIVVKQLPIIEEQLRSLSGEIEQRISEALSLVCTEESVKEVKKVRAELNKQHAELEEQRKAVKAAVLDPYNAFEAVYKECVTSKFNAADKDLKQKIGEVEDGLKDEKSGELLEYFAEYAQSLHLDWLPLDAANINVTLSASMKSLKEKARAFIDRVSEDVNAIEEQEHKDEIMVEYKRCFHLAKAMAVVADRHKAIEQQQKKKEEAAQVIQAEQEAAKKVEAFAPPVEVTENKTEEKTFSVKFIAYGSMEQLKEMKRYALEIGITLEALQ